MAQQEQVPFGAHCHQRVRRPDVAPLRAHVAPLGHWGLLSPVLQADSAVPLADVSPPPAGAVLPVDLDVLVALACPGALVVAVWVVAKPRFSAQGLAVWVQPTRLAPPEVPAASAGLL